MPNFNRASEDRPVVGILLILLLVGLAHFVRGDELTGLPDDPKDLLPAPAIELKAHPELSFQELPSWSHVTRLPPLPDRLMPLGKQLVVLTVPAPAPLAPPKETPPSPVKVEAKPSTPPAVPTPTPELTAVSPFLQWIMSDPKAPAEARQEAARYKASATPQPDAPASSSSPYWLPPLPEAPDARVQPVAGSAASYQTPQR